LIPKLKTERLLLRAWRAEDREPFARMNADPEVREFYPALMSRAESDALADRIEAELAAEGFGGWAVEIPGVTSFAGYVGLSRPLFEASFTPCVEIGWRLARPLWGRGYATEGARAALAFGFEKVGLAEIVSFAVTANLRSIRVMEKIGMRFAGEFEHPQIAPGHRLRRHVLYRIGRAEQNKGL
jgi:RimJ/RimL family protein N-acetyltransferase